MGGATAVAGVLVGLDDQGWGEWVFGAFMLTCLALVLRLGLRAWWEARAEHVRARELVATAPEAVARRAVSEERLRLSADVAACIRSCVESVAAEVPPLYDAVDPRPGLRHVHAHAQRATSELRRMLGLLRERDGMEVPSSPTIEQRARHPYRRDLVVGSVMALFAGAETAAFTMTEWAGLALGSVVMSALAASTLALRAARPAAAAYACAVLYLLGVLLAAPVTAGLWAVVTLGALSWTVCSAPGWRLHQLGGAAALTASVSWAMGRTDPDNTGVMVVSMVVAVLGGLAVKVNRRRHLRARRVALARERELDLAAEAAVQAERLAVARELHDVVSHAVGVVAMQAAAAEMSWPHDRVAVRAAVDVIATTTTTTLAELDRLDPTGGGGTASHTAADLNSLVDRIRAAGTAVELTVEGRTVAENVVYRIVQEALTNVVRHAPGARVRVRVGSNEAGTTVQVSDDGPGPAPGSPRGYGLVGLAERVAFAGGTLDVGRGPEGRGFVVSATLPGRVEVVTT